MIENQPEVFAQHYAEAGLAEKSVLYWGKAGQRSAARSAMAEATAQLQKGLDQLRLLPDNPEHQRQELEFWKSLGAVLQTVKGSAAPETGNAYARARALWERLGYPSEFFQIPYGQSIHYAFRGEFDLAQQLADDLLRLSGQRNDSSGLILGHFCSGRNLMSVGRFEPSRSHLEAVLTLYDPVLHRSLVDEAEIRPHVAARASLGIVLFCLGFGDRALAESRAANAEARALAHPPSLAASLALGARLISLYRDNRALAERADELAAVATTQRFAHWRAEGKIYRGWATVKNGDVARGISLLRSGSTAFRDTGAETVTPYHTALLAAACDVAGQIEEGLTLLDEALSIIERDR